MQTTGTKDWDLCVFLVSNLCKQRLVRPGCHLAVHSPSLCCHCQTPVPKPTLHVHQGTVAGFMLLCQWILSTHTHTLLSCCPVHHWGHSVLQPCRVLSTWTVLEHGPSLHKAATSPLLSAEDAASASNMPLTACAWGGGPPGMHATCTDYSGHTSSPQHTSTQPNTQNATHTQAARPKR